MSDLCPNCLQPLPAVTPAEPQPRTFTEARLLTAVAAGHGTASAVARALLGRRPSRAQVEQARRLLETTVRAGLLRRATEPTLGGVGGTSATVYRLPESPHLA